MAEITKLLPMAEITKLLLSALAGGLLVGFIGWRGYTLRATKLSLPFIDINLSRFSSLTPVQLFQSVTMAVMPMTEFDSAAEVAGSVTPIMLIHEGWNIVCEAFVRRFQAYPEDEHIYAAASTIGGQNVEFIKMYRDIHLSALRQASAIDRKFAAHYLSRAPSLAERVEGKPTKPGNAMSQTLLAQATHIIRST